jgi:TPR repeat protein
VYWYRKAAQQGDAEAQFNFGSMFANGKGVSKNYVEAYAWWSIAAAQGREDAKKYKGTIEKRMTRDLLAKGQELAAEYWKKYVVPFQKD